MSRAASSGAVPTSVLRVPRETTFANFLDQVLLGVYARELKIFIIFAALHGTCDMQPDTMSAPAQHTALGSHSCRRLYPLGRSKPPWH